MWQERERERGGDRDEDELLEPKLPKIAVWVLTVKTVEMLIRM
jgi:hypothetical protein